MGRNTILSTLFACHHVWERSGLHLQKEALYCSYRRSTVVAFKPVGKSVFFYDSCWLRAWCSSGYSNVRRFPFIKGTLAWDDLLLIGIRGCFLQHIVDLKKCFWLRLDSWPTTMLLHMYCPSHCKDTVSKIGKIFPKRNMRGLSPNFYISISVNDLLYVPTIGLPIWLQRNRWTDPAHRCINIEIGNKAAQFDFWACI